MKYGLCRRPFTSSRRPSHLFVRLDSSCRYSVDFRLPSRPLSCTGLHSTISSSSGSNGPLGRRIDADPLLGQLHARLPAHELCRGPPDSVVSLIPSPSLRSCRRRLFFCLGTASSIFIGKRQSLTDGHRQAPTPEAFDNAEQYYALLSDLPHIVLGTIAFVFGMGLVGHLLKLHKGTAVVLDVLDRTSS